MKNFLKYLSMGFLFFALLLAIVGLGINALHPLKEDQGMFFWANSLIFAFAGMIAAAAATDMRS